MRQRLNKLRLAIKRTPARLHDRMFDIACRVLLPISTMCKVCNMLRGMLLGIVIGSALTAIAFLCIGGRY
jgi:2-keto-3-deoxy-galactonokinase